MKKILILASNPRRDLNLDREIRDLKGVIERSTQRDQLQVDIELAVRPSDLQELLFRSQPQIVHFCGHGAGEPGLVFEDDNGQERLVKAEVLSDLFRLFANRGLECVLLNACYSEVQANAIVQHIHSVIGMNREIRDDAAIAFATGFYRALSYACSIAEAFEFGCNAIRLQLTGGLGTRAAEPTRKLEAVDVAPTEIPQIVVIPEHLKPILKQRAHPTSVVVPNSDHRHTPATELQQDLDAALGQETALKQYRERVREFLDNRKLSDVEKIRLKQFRQRLGLSIEDAERILQEEWEPIRRGQQAYREILMELVQGGCYPFSTETQQELQQFQVEYGLTDEEVEEITKPILEATQTQSTEFEVVILDQQGQTISRTSKQAQVFVENLGDEARLSMVLIPAGQFLMGSPVEEEGRSDEESPQHPVKLAAFWMGQYPITQAQWRAVAAWPAVEISLNPDPTQFKGNNRPVETVSWYEATEFCQRLSRQTGQTYRLPSEAEWEYACRAGTTTPFHFGQTITAELANYNGHYAYGRGVQGLFRQETTPVGQFGIANDFGLYDMHGNVWEWCADHWHKDYVGAPPDGSAWVTGGDAARRSLRGGSWYYDPWDCRCAYRVGINGNYKDNLIGFRVVCSTLCKD